MKSMDVVWTLAAELDLQAIYEAKEGQEEGAGDGFYAEVLRATNLLARFPHLGSALMHRRLRRVLVYNRHCGLFYVPEARGLVLHALLDLRQAPQTIERRLRGL